MTVRGFDPQLTPDGHLGIGVWRNAPRRQAVICRYKANPAVELKSA